MPKIKPNLVYIENYIIPQSYRRIPRIIFLVILAMFVSVLFCFGLKDFLLGLRFLSIWGFLLGFTYWPIMVYRNTDEKPTRKLANYYLLCLLGTFQTTVAYYSLVVYFNLPYKGFIMFWSHSIHFFPFFYLLVDFLYNNLIIGRRGFLFLLYFDLAYIVFYGICEFGFNTQIYPGFSLKSLPAYVSAAILIGISFLVYSILLCLQKRKYKIIRPEPLIVTD